MVSWFRQLFFYDVVWSAKTHSKSPVTRCCVSSLCLQMAQHHLQAQWWPNWDHIIPIDMRGRYFKGSPLLVLKPVYSGILVQYHGCWCPGSLRGQVFSNHDIDCVKQSGPGHHRRRFQLRAQSQMRITENTDIFFIFRKMNLARLGLISMA